ncbi:MAG TPA: hypothetical protein DC042_07920 [Bacteroidales bacterium]|nr:hypothetical protein [Bacteroidales bacterium]
MSKPPLLILAIAAITLIGCNQKSGSTNSVSPDLVINPVSAGNKQKPGELPVLVFDQTKHDFGLVVQSEKTSYKFICTNTGGSNAVISNVSSTCGCTITDWTKSPIKPGDKGEVEVVFNASGKPAGYISKTVKVLANTQPNTIDLEVTAEIYIPGKK